LGKEFCQSRGRLPARQRLLDMRMGRGMREHPPTPDIYLNLLNALPVPLFMADDKFQTTFANKSAYNALGYSQRDRLLQMTDILLDKDLAQFEANISQIAAGSDLGPSSFTAKRKDGSTFPAEFTTARVMKDGKRIGYVGIIQDRTNHLKLEDKLKKNEENLQTLFKSIPDPVYVNKMDGTAIDANPAAEKMLGFSREELLTKQIGTVDTPDEADRIKERVSKLKSDGHITFVTHHQHKDGNQIPVEVKATIIKWNGEDAIVSVCRDITKRINTEQEMQIMIESLQESTRKFETIFKNSPTAISITDPDSGKIVDSNDAFSQASGYSSQELADSTTLSLNLWDDKSMRDEVIYALRRGEKIYNKEYVFNTLSFFSPGYQSRQSKSNSFNDGRYHRAKRGRAITVRCTFGKRRIFS